MIITLLISNPAYAQFLGNACYDATSLSCWPRGCGKTTIGMALAQATGFRFADTDRWLQSHVQMSVADIVEKEGWGGFRARETAPWRR